MAPTIGGATVDNPGTNFATSRTCPPQRWKCRSDLRTQVSGDNEMRQRVRITPAPKWRPAQYHIRSASRHASKVTSSTPASESCALAANAPATTSVGTAGTGTPACSTSTLRKISSSPYCAISAMIAWAIEATLETLHGLQGTDHWAAGPRLQIRPVRTSPTVVTVRTFLRTRVRV